MTSPEFHFYDDFEYEVVVELWKRAGIKLTYSDNKSELLRISNHPGNNFLILKQDDIIIGTAILAFDGRRGYIHHVAVEPDLQNRGYGKLLMKEIDRICLKKGIVKAHVFIETKNKSVLEFYKPLNWFVRDDIILMSKTFIGGEFHEDQDVK